MPLAAASCGSPAAQVQPTPSSAAGAQQTAAAPPGAAQANPQAQQQGFIPKLVGNGDAASFRISSDTNGGTGPVPTGTTCAGTVSWTGPNPGSTPLPQEGAPHPGWGKSTLPAHALPANATKVTWQVYCTQIDHSRGVTIQRSQPVVATVPGSGASSSARHAQR